VRVRSSCWSVVHFSEDVPSYDPKSGKKASAEQIVTDGCGYMNRGALSAISKHLGMADLPTAVQGRIAGAKGVWLLHPKYQHDPNETPKIWIRDSQYKIHIPDDQMDRAHRIFDHVAPNRVTFPARLSMQTIVNLSHNGVPDSVFVKLMEEGMSGDFEKLTTWKGPNAMKVCLHAVGRAGNVAGLRLQRQTAGMGRALGYVSREKDKEDRDESVEVADHETPAVVGRHPVSLQPVGLGEKIFEMIAAGFHPLESETLNSDLRQLVKSILDSYIKSYHIPNPQSCEAFIVPGMPVFEFYFVNLPADRHPSDPFGMLAENEIYFRASQNIKDPQADCNPELLTGPVLVSCPHLS
jgi:RNA-dependent RNA polymerase